MRTLYKALVFDAQLTSKHVFVLAFADFAGCMFAID
jgi:hypothetical protein